MRDDLKKRQSQIEQEQDPRQKVDLMIELGFAMWGSDTENAVQTVLKAGDLAKSINYTRGIAHCRMGQGFLALFETRYNEALQINYETVPLFEEIEDHDGIAWACSQRGVIFRSIGEFDQAIQAFMEGMNALKASTDQTSNAHRRNKAWLYSGLAGVYTDLKEYESALKYYQDSLDIFNQIKFISGQSVALSGIGKIYQNWHQYDQALAHHFQALELSRIDESDPSISRAYADIGSCYEQLEDYDKALEYHFKSLQIRRQIQYRNAIITNLLHIGRIYLKKDEFEKAESHLIQGLTESEAIGVKPKICMAYQLMSQLSEKRGEWTRALSYHKRFYEMEKVVYSEEAASRIRNLKATFQIEAAQKEAEIYRLKNVELAQALEQLQEMQGQLVMQEKMASLGNLVAGIAHEVNNPIGAVNSTTDVSSRALQKIRQVLQETDDIETLRQNRVFQRAMNMLEENIQITATASQRVVNIVRSLKRFARLDEAELQLSDIHEGIESTLTLLSHELKNRVEVLKNFGDIPLVRCYANQLNQVFMNVLVNAIHAISNGSEDSQKGRIVITTARVDDHVEIKFADNGKGIPQDRLKQIFDPGFTTKSRGVGTGLGLSISYNIIQKHHGQITVQSEVGQGTEFIVSLPLS